MYWQEWSGRLKAELDLDTEPVAVAFEGPGDSQAGGSKEKVSVCQALKRASGGEPVVISRETCGCPGGLVSLGLGQTPPQGKERLADFLINKEKVFCSRIAIHRGQQSVPPPVGVGTRVSFSPLSKANALPDVVVFLGTPGSLHRLISFAGYWEGGSMKAELAGPACRTGIAYPAVTGEIGLSLLDFGARRLAGFEGRHLLLAIPLHRMMGVIAALDRGAGGEREKSSESVEREIDELGAVAPV
jgi:uncharacterized protein (DUF169 family)